MASWPLRGHDSQWRCRINDSTAAAIVTTKDNLLYLVEIDPEGQRQGSQVRVLQRYNAGLISKITSKKSSKVSCLGVMDAFLGTPQAKQAKVLVHYTYNIVAYNITGFRLSITIGSEQQKKPFI